MRGGTIDTLCIILENGGGRFRLAAYPEADIRVLCGAGIVVRDGVVGSVPCDNCDSGHLAEVRRGQDGLWGYTCPEAGFIELPPDEIAAGYVRTETLVARLAEALNVTSRAQVSVSERIMPLGKFSLGELPCFAWLAMRLSSPDDYAALHAEIRRRPFPEFGVVFVTAGVAASPFQLPGNYHLIPLRDAVLIETEGRLRIEVEVLKAFVPKVGGARPGRPSGEDATWKVVEHLIGKGAFPRGRNACQRAITTAYEDVWPGRIAPVRSTLQSHLQKLEMRIREKLKQ